MPEYVGRGNEGVVYRNGDLAVKQFHPGALSDDDAANLVAILPTLGAGFPVGINLTRSTSGWQVSYPWFDSEEVCELGYHETVQFLLRCLQSGVVPDNFKLANLRRTDGGLVYIDIGKQLRTMTQSVFRDTCAKAYALLTKIMDDPSLVRDFASFRASGGIDGMVGFPSFYLSILQGHLDQCTAYPSVTAGTDARFAHDTSLLIKCCAMDSDYLERQICHIVSQLSAPSRFLEVVVVLDTRTGAFLRQHSAGDIGHARRALARLVEAGVVDRVIEPPECPAVISAFHTRWFSQDCHASHTKQGIPVFPQIWAFEQIRSKYVLQCDCDVIIGRLDRDHDYLADMKTAHLPTDVMGVGFNIPQVDAHCAKDYGAPVGEYKPEVRLGLFDLCRLTASLPWPNKAADGHLELGWYQSLHKVLKDRSLRCVRGGDPRTFYIHPLNNAKRQPGLFSKVRSAVESGAVPPEQRGKWDLVGDAGIWGPARRHEDVVFLLMGRNTDPRKVARCFASLRRQTDQSFGVIVIDDASDPLRATAVSSCAHGFDARLTMLHNDERIGRVPNKWMALHDLVARDSTMVAVLDLDDALISADVAGTLRDFRSKGAQLVVGGMFRPEKPLKLYPVDFTKAAANRGSGNVWNHLRAFTRSAYLTLSRDDLQQNGEWLDRVSDYLTMVPMASRTTGHIALEGFCYWHERTTPSTPEKRVADDKVIDWVLGRNKIA